MRYRVKMWARDTRPPEERNKNGLRKLPKESELVVEGDLIRALEAAHDRLSGLSPERRAMLARIQILETD